jgi:hypothetical protein
MQHFIGRAFGSANLFLLSPCVRTNALEEIGPMTNAMTLERKAYTLSEFLEAFRISRASYYKLRGENRGPREIRVGVKILILATDAEAWAQARRGGSAIRRFAKYPIAIWIPSSRRSRQPRPSNAKAFADTRRGRPTCSGIKRGSPRP